MRCSWCNLNNPKYVTYHDHEWGILKDTSDRYLFEMLILESFQAGLSWECVLNKRDSIKEAYDNFNIDKVCLYGDEKILELINNKEIIRNKLKINASIKNARVFRKISLEYGSFYNYLKTFISDTIYEVGISSNKISDMISVDLRRRGMSFVGSTIIYAYLQAIGLIYSHEKNCFMYKDKEE